MTPVEHHDGGGAARDEVLAGEYVLGVLSRDARAQIERRMASDQRFAARIERWQLDLSPFNADYQDAQPGPAVFPAIERRLFGEAPVAQRSGRLWESVLFWRWTTLTASLAAVCAVVFAAGLVPTGRPAAPLVAQLAAAPNSAVSMMAMFDAASGRMHVVPVAAGRPKEKSLELWVVPGSGNPRSLGVVPYSADGELIIAPDMRGSIADGATLAVTLEPFGGSPTGLPTGPIVASGTAQKL